MKDFVETGIEGLDEILYGGLPIASSILVEGQPGAGKTTMGFQFLYQGAIKNEPGIYITFEELPEKLYTDMNKLGWDIRELEGQGLLRVYCVSPEVVLDDMKNNKGIFRQILREFNCKRLVIDSISLFEQSVKEEDYRSMTYSLRNVLTNMSITSLLLQEKKDQRSSIIPIEHYIVDGIIHLSYDKKLEYKVRTLEVSKMRGKHIKDGKHIYRLTHEGIVLVPTYSVPHDHVFLNKKYVSTGLEKLDKVLNGGIPDTSFILIETDHKAKYLTFITSIIVKQLETGKRVMILLSNVHMLTEFVDFLNMHDINVKQLINDRKIYFVELYERPVPDWIKSNVICGGKVRNGEFSSYLYQKIKPLFEEGNWFFYHDINAMVSRRGTDFVINMLPDVFAMEKGLELTVLLRVNPEELDNKLTALLRENSNGIITTWVSGHYQFLQVVKSISKQISEPFVVSSSNNKPFIKVL